MTYYQYQIPPPSPQRCHTLPSVSLSLRFRHVILGAAIPGGGEELFAPEPPSIDGLQTHISLLGLPHGHRHHTVLVTLT